MARTVVVLCDVHLEEGKRVEAEELPPIVVEGRGPRVLALCAQHRHEFYDPFVDLVDDLARDESDDEPDQGGEAGGQLPDEQESSDEEEESSDEQQPPMDDPDRVVAETPAMTAVPNQPDTARWQCPVKGCDKSYSASCDLRADDLNRLGNLHLSTAHHLDKAARQELLTA